MGDSKVTVSKSRFWIVDKYVYIARLPPLVGADLLQHEVRFTLERRQQLTSNFRQDTGTERGRNRGARTKSSGAERSRGDGESIP